MFEHFTFGAPAQPVSSHQDDISTSPTDCSFLEPMALPPMSTYQNPPQNAEINDIVDKFSHHSLSLEENERPQSSIWEGRTDTIPSPDFVDTAMEYTIEEMSYHSTKHGLVTLQPYPQARPSPHAPTLPHPSNGIVASRRLQRQVNVQLQSSSSHIKDIKALVEGMIASNSQCTLRNSMASTPTSPARPPNLLVDTMADEDEGFAEMEDSQTGLESLRRVSTPSGIRKMRALRMRSSAESLSGSKVMIDENGKLKVRCVPRMRKRKARGNESVRE